MITNLRALIDKQILLISIKGKYREESGEYVC